MELTDIDILMLPIDDSFHILKEDETEDVIKTVNPKIVVPMHYKIAELEPTSGKPKNLETVDIYLSKRKNVTHLNGNTTELGLSDLPDEMEYLVFRHSPDIEK